MDGWFATMVTGNMKIRTALNNYFHYIFTCSFIDCLVYKMSEGVKKSPSQFPTTPKCYFLNNTEFNGRYVNLSWVYGPLIPASSLQIWQVHMYICIHIYSIPTLRSVSIILQIDLFFQPWFVEIYNYNLLLRPKYCFGLRSLVWTASLVWGQQVSWSAQSVSALCYSSTFWFIVTKKQYLVWRYSISL